MFIGVPLDGIGGGGLGGIEDGAGRGGQRRAEHQEKDRPREGRVCGGCSRQPEGGLKSFIC